MTNNYTLFRPFDETAAKRGDPICFETGDPRTFLYGPDIDGYVICLRNDRGVFITPENLRMAPLGWCAGKPVYPGDTLYFARNGESYTFPREAFGRPNDLTGYSWEPPTVKSLCFRGPVGQLIWRKEGYEIPQEWTRFPKGDIEGELE